METCATGGPFLFSIDLEDVRMLVPGGERYIERVPAMTRRYLQFFAEHKMRATFFTVGDVARRYPDLIHEIVEHKHEIACHTNTHIPLDQQTPQTFREDLKANLDYLCSAGAQNIVGFRAPTFSLTKSTSWAYAVLKDLGFQYSSSVLPAVNPLYGWPEFGTEPRYVEGILEIPVTLSQLSFLNVPFGGGVYFRVLPLWALHRLFACHHGPVYSYMHPYDIDTEQELFMHPGIHGSWVYNALMYYNRGSVFKKLKSLLHGGRTIMPYCEFIELAQFTDRDSAVRHMSI